MSIAQDAFDYLNQLRANPKLAIPDLQEQLKYYKNKQLCIPGKITLITQEGAAVVQECIQFLQNLSPIGKLYWEEGLENAARDHALDIGPKGITGHTGSDGSSMTDRIERYGEWMGNIGENISFGQKTGKEGFTTLLLIGSLVIIQLIIDDGVKTRGHRKNCFKEDYKLIGICDGEHKQYGTLCVFDFAEEFTPKDGGAANKTKKPLKKSEVPQTQTQTQTQKQQQPPPPSQSKNIQPQQQQEDIKDDQDEDEDEPPGCISISTQTSTTIKNGKKKIVTKKTYKMKDGSTLVKTTETIEG